MRLLRLIKIPGARRKPKPILESRSAYRAALEFIIVIKDVVEKLPRGNPYLADQLKQAGTSVPLNIAEGAKELSLDEKARFYRMAKRSATEYASILDVCRQLMPIDENQNGRGRELLLRIAAMLTKRLSTNLLSSSFWIILASFPLETIA